MPGGISGREVAARARQLKPCVKVLLTSGYAEELVHGDELEREKLWILRKPYHRADLIAALREVPSPDRHQAFGEVDPYQTVVNRPDGYCTRPGMPAVAVWSRIAALERVFADEVIVAPDQGTLVIEALPFPVEATLVACTSGPLAECLAGRLRSGTRSLSDALSQWFIPRHAAHFAQAVQAGKIVLWIPISDADDELHAYASLLAHSSDIVGVHDLIVPGKT